MSTSSAASGRLPYPPEAEVAGPRDLTSEEMATPEGRVDPDSSTMVMPPPPLGATSPRVLHSTQNSSAEIGEADALLRR